MMVEGVGIGWIKLILILKNLAGIVGFVTMNVQGNIRHMNPGEGHREREREREREKKRERERERERKREREREQRQSRRGSASSIRVLDISNFLVVQSSCITG